MSTHTNSHLAFEAIRADGKLSTRQALILQWLLANPQPWTDREIAAKMGYPDMNCVRPRITELVQLGLVMEHDNVKCAVTGKTVRRVVPAQQQGELPL